MLERHCHAGRQHANPQHVPSGRQHVPAVGHGLVWPSGQQPISVHSWLALASQHSPCGWGNSQNACAMGTGTVLAGASATHEAM